MKWFFLAPFNLFSCVMILATLTVHLIVLIIFVFNSGKRQNYASALSKDQNGNDIIVGPCVWAVNRTCPSIHIKFYLYTKDNPHSPIEITNINSTEHFNISNPTKIIIHGYNSDMNLSYLVDIRRGYLLKGDYNIIAIDWQKYSNGPVFCYPFCAHNARQAGRCTAHLIKEMISLGVEDIHLIGFSLGAHVAGFTASYAKPHLLPRITGLDPARPLFEKVTNDERLDSSDAQFVDIIHTNALFQGQMLQSGDVDFYVNGGVNQPGCIEEGLFKALNCDHHRAPAYYAESITTKTGFWAWKCYSYFYYLLGMCSSKKYDTLMGAFVNQSVTGLHFLSTASSSPYALGRS